MLPAAAELADELASHYARSPAVSGVGLGGSSARGTGDADSDIDVYVFTTGGPEFERTVEFLRHRPASRQDLQLDYFDPGDEWIDARTGVAVDVMFWDADWIERTIDRSLRDHRASLGYSTCHLHTLRHLRILFDRAGWLGALHERCQSPYPEPLRRAIIDRNRPLLRSVLPAYAHQLEKAVRRADPISTNHRTAALLASYFDILFALNRLTHPGEKRLLELARAQCSLLPEEMERDVRRVLATSGEGRSELTGHVERLIERIEALLDENP